LCISGATPEATFPDRRPLFYYITGRRQLAGITLIRCIRRAIDGGVDFIQIREKDMEDGALFELVCRVMDLARGTGCRILVNGRADIALAAGAHGVHLPSGGLRPSEIRPWIPKGFIVGVSVHTMKEIRSGIDTNYVLLGHVFPTASKQGLGLPLGLDCLRKVCARIPLPVFALGGMRPESLGPVLNAGAAGIAGISIFQNKDEFDRLKSLMKPR
jgi:thiamine-phosphate diphosphorylase